MDETKFEFKTRKDGHMQIHYLPKNHELRDARYFLLWKKELEDLKERLREGKEAIFKDISKFTIFHLAFKRGVIEIEVWDIPRLDYLAKVGIYSTTITIDEAKKIGIIE